MGEKQATYDDPEIEALHQVLVAIEPLDSEARRRVMDYLIDRLDHRTRFVVDPVE